MAQADQPSNFDGPARRIMRAAVIFLFAALLSACGSGGFSLKKAEVDRSIYTSSTPVSDKPFDPQRLSDEATIRNAVTSADIEMLSGASLPWANAGTGARGHITAIAEDTSAGRLCRRFSVTRERFDGIAMFRGEACMVSPGAWRMESFEPFASGISS